MVYKRVDTSVTILKYILLITASLIISLNSTPKVSALTTNDRRLLYTPFYDPDENEFADTCASNISLIGNDNAEQIWNFFIAKGMQPPQVAGIMGNLQAESGLNPRRVQSTPTPEGDSDYPTGNGIGYGLAQWTFTSRQQPLVDLASEVGAIPGDLGIQLQYIMQELEGPYRRVYDELMNITEVDQASDLIMVRYEGPADQSESAKEKRRSFSRNFLSQFGSITSSVPLGGLCDTNASPVSPGECPTGPVSIDQTVVIEGIRVHTCLAGPLAQLLAKARADGINLSGSGWRDPQTQIRLRQQRCPGRVYDPGCRGNPPTAVPGSSRHERGVAIDFSYNGQTICFSTNKSVARAYSNCATNNQGFQWLDENASNYGLQVLSSEAWHWSIDGR